MRGPRRLAGRGSLARERPLRAFGWAVVSVVVALGLGLVAVVARRRRFEDELGRHVAQLRSDAESSDGRFATEEVADLPAPVRRYFERVLGDGQPDVRRATLRQRGEFRLGSDGGWRPFTATQHVTTRPPGFVWDATIEVAPLLSVRVFDAFGRGDGLLRANLLGAVPVASAGPNPEMNEGELVRYLAEGAWVPTALLPSRGVEWEGIDDRSARATLEHRGVTATAVFHFDDAGLVERVTSRRYRQEDESYAPWTGYFREYETRDGMTVPTEAEVEWNLPTGDRSYWRATLEDVEYHVAEQLTDATP